MKRSKLLTIGMLVIFLGLGQVWGASGKPNNVYKTDAIVVDGNVGEWANAEWAPLDQNYYLMPTIVTGAYSIAWSDTKNKLYIAAKIQDMDHFFSNTFVFGSADHDLIEVYVHMTGTFLTPAGVETGTDYSSYQAAAQEYALHLKPGGGCGAWCSGNNQPWPDGMIAYAGHEGPNGWTYYEMEFTPWIFWGGMMGDPKPADEQLDLAAGVTVGVDLTMSDVDHNPTTGAGEFKGFAGENMMAGKYGNWNQIATHTLSATSLVIPSPIPTLEPTPTPTPGGPVTVSGNVILSDYDPLDYEVPVAVKLVMFDDSWNILYSDNLTMTGTRGVDNWNAEFSILPAVTAGTYNLAVKSYGHCATVVPCAIDGATTTLGDILLRGGDAHGDNEVFFTPLSIVLKYFGTSGDGDPF